MSARRQLQTIIPSEHQCKKISKNITYQIQLYIQRLMHHDRVWFVLEMQTEWLTSPNFKTFPKCTAIEMEWSCCQSSPLDPRHTIGSPQADPHIYGRLSFDKAVIDKSVREASPFESMVLEYPHGKNKPQPPWLPTCHAQRLSQNGHSSTCQSENYTHLRNRRRKIFVTFR